MPTYNLFCDPAIGQTLRSDGALNDYGSIFGNCSAILGGKPSPSPTNVNCSDLSVIVQGDSNCINTFNLPAMNGAYNFIGNGSGNLVSGCFNFVGAGENNHVNTFLSGVGVQLFGSVITGGVGNNISDDGNSPATTAFIGGGSGNGVFGRSSSVVGGIGNYAMGCSAFIGGGENNRIQPGYTVNTITGGCKNCIGGAAPGAATASYSFIGAGAENCVDSAVLGTVFGTIGGGALNKICDGTTAASIFGGWQNTVAGNASFVGGGCANVIGSALGLVDCAVIAGGQGNVICDNGMATAAYSFVGGGFNNCALGCLATVGGGCLNVAQGNYSFVGGGGGSTIAMGNIAGGDSSFVGGGAVNCISNVSGFASFIGGGVSNVVFGETSVITGGQGNQISFCALPVLGANASFIGGGQGHCINSSAAVATAYAIIGGGQKNTVCAGVMHSGIFSGLNNCVAGSCSAILGGSGNSDGGLNNVFIAGSGITAVNPNSLHVNALWANGIPGPYSVPPGLATGTVWYGPPGIIGACALYIV